VARVEVALPGRSYPVFIGQGALQELPKLVREMGVSGAAIVTDTTVGKAWGGALETGLTFLCEDRNAVLPGRAAAENAAEIRSRFSGKLDRLAEDIVRNTSAETDKRLRRRFRQGPQA